MLHRLILKVTKFQLPPKHLSTVTKNIFGGGGASQIGLIGLYCIPTQMYQCEIKLFCVRALFTMLKCCSVHMQVSMPMRSQNSFHISISINDQTITTLSGGFLVTIGLHVTTDVEKRWFLCFLPIQFKTRVIIRRPLLIFRPFSGAECSIVLSERKDTKRKF